MIKIPSIGSEIEVTTRYPNIYYYTYEKEPFQFTTRKGKVIKNAKWVDGNSFSLDTGNKEYPISIININKVIQIKLISGELNNIRKFKVKGSSDNFYIVTKNNEHYSCNCTGFKYYAKCKHITKVIQKY